MKKQRQNRAKQGVPFRIIPSYTGVQTLEASLEDPKSLRLLWLEILLNGNFPWEAYQDLPEVESAFEKACIWYGHYKTMIDGLIGRPPLPRRTGKIDEREIRTFQEAIYFASN